ncbi:MAG: hypothetical protein GXP49_12220 [Deltaproteobacteria bacterium]|nr:hypothetical protein [Deltaproteobacteria bacterium]
MTNLKSMFSSLYPLFMLFLPAIHLGCAVDDSGKPCGTCGEGRICNLGLCMDVSIDLPRDAGPHDFDTEWWYYTGHLQKDNQRFGFEVTAFSYDINGTPAYMCHVGFTDQPAQAHYHTDGITFEPARWSSSPLILEVMTCRIELSGDGHDHITGRIPDGKERDGNPGEWLIDLFVQPVKRPVFHGRGGIIQMSDNGGNSWYYSYTRLSARGSITTPRTGKLDVQGIAWMDHQWGDFNVNQFKGWDWWSVQLDDDYELMLFKFRDWQNRPAGGAGTIILPKGDFIPIKDQDIHIKPLRTWKSTHTDGIYPMDWDIDILDDSWHLEVRSVLDDQEMYNPAQNYWEGLVDITGVRDGCKIRGAGYTELSGYATDPLDPKP